jgi:hypothetical protein
VIVSRGWGFLRPGDLNPEIGEISPNLDLNSKTGENPRIGEFMRPTLGAGDVARFPGVGTGVHGSRHQAWAHSPSRCPSGTHPRSGLMRRQRLGLPVSQLFPRPAAAHVPWLLSHDVGTGSRVVITGLDQNPAALAGAGQGESASELAAAQKDRQMARLITNDLSGALVPYDHRARAGRGLQPFLSGRPGAQRCARTRRSARRRGRPASPRLSRQVKGAGTLMRSGRQL